MTDGSGRRCGEFATYCGLAGCFLKTSSGYCQQVMFEESCSEAFCETWPRSGMLTSSGIAYRLEPLPAHPTSVIAYGCWPPPSNMTDQSSQETWPTPTALEYVDGATNFESLARVDKGGRILRRMATRTLAGEMPDPRLEMFPTPSAADDRDRGNLSHPAIQRRKRLGKQLNLSMVVSPVSGALNADWVELLMGYPLGHTIVGDGNAECPE